MLFDIMFNLINSRTLSPAFIIFLFLILITLPILSPNVAGNMRSVFAQEIVPQEGGQSNGGEGEVWTGEVEYRSGNSSHGLDFKGTFSFKTIPSVPDGSSGKIEGTTQLNVSARHNAFYPRSDVH